LSGKTKQGVISLNMNALDHVHNVNLLAPRANLKYPDI